MALDWYVGLGDDRRVFFTRNHLTLLFQKVLFVPMKHELSSDGHCQIPICYHAPLGGQIAFMVWNALAIVLENTVCHWIVVQQMARILPPPIRTFFVIAPGIMVAHWFVDPYVVSNFFAHGQLGLPMLLPIEEGVMK